MRNKLFLFLYYIVIIISGCDNNDTEETLDPEFLHTKYIEVSETQNGVVTFVGAALIVPQNPKDYGFVYGTNEFPSYENDSIASLGKLENISEFSNTVNGLVPGIMYHVRSFVKTKKNLYYGSEIDFHMTRINRLTPALAGRGDTVIINGTNFSQTITDNIVKIDNKQVEVISLEENDFGSDLLIRIPTENLSIGSKTFSFEINNLKAEYENDFVITPYTRIHNFPGRKRKNAVGFALNGLFYIGTGIDEIGIYKNDFYCYNPNNKTWASISDLPGTPRSGASAFVIDNYAYVGLGTYGSGSLSSFYKYDPSTDNWTQVTNFPGTRATAVSFTLNGEGYVGLGGWKMYDNNAGNPLFGDFYKYNPFSDTWIVFDTTTISPRTEAASFVYNNIAYICGSTFPYPWAGFDGFWEYNLQKNEWTNLESPKGDENGIQNPKGFIINNKGYIVRTLSECWEFDFIAKEWTFYSYSGAGLPSCFFGGIGISNGEFAIIGFDGFNDENVFYEFKPY